MWISVPFLQRDHVFIALSEYSRTMSTLTFELNELPEAIVVRLCGEAGTEAASAMQMHMMGLTVRRPALVVFDLAEVDFMASLFMGSLVTFQRRPGAARRANQARRTITSGAGSSATDPFARSVRDSCNGGFGPCWRCRRSRIGGSLIWSAGIVAPPVHRSGHPPRKRAHARTRRAERSFCPPTSVRRRRRPSNEIGEPDVVQAEQRKHGRVQIVHVDFVLDRPEAQLIGRPDGFASLNSAAGHPRC